MSAAARARSFSDRLLRCAGLLRAMLRKVRTMRPQRSAASRMRWASARSSGRVSHFSSSRPARPSTIASGLFNSCATPASRLPMAVSFSLWRNASRWRSICCAASRRCEMSLTIELKWRTPSITMRDTITSTGNSLPSARRPVISTRLSRMLSAPSGLSHGAPMPKRSRWRCGTISVSASAPRARARGRRNIVSAAGFHSTTRPAPSTMTIAAKA